MFQLDKTHQKYQKYNPSNIDWIVDIPDGWEVKKIKYWASNQNKKTTFSPDIFSVALENIESWTWKYISQEGEKVFEGDMNIFKNGDILFWKLRPYLAKVYKTNCDWTCVGEFLILHPKETILQDFLYYRLISSDFITQVNNSTFWAKMPRADWDFIWNSKVPVPSLDEQQKIATYLDEKTALLDEAIAKKKKQIELFAEHRTALINNAITKWLDPNVEMNDSGIEWHKKIPKHWDKTTLRWASKIYSGGTPDKENLSYWEDGTIPWINSWTVNNWYITEPSTYITEDAYNHSSAKWIPAGALVLALAWQGKTKWMVAQLWIRTTCNQSMAAIVPDKTLFNRFVYWWLIANYQNIRNLWWWDNRDWLNLEMIKSIQVPLPTIQEQQKIVDYLDKETKYIDDMIAKIEKSIELLEEYKTSLISHVVSGKIKIW